MAKQPEHLVGKGFQKGKSGNPSGRPKKGSAWADIANELLDSGEISITVTKDGKQTKKLDLKTDVTFRHAVLVSVIKEAMSGNMQAVNHLAERTAGKVKDVLATEQEVTFVMANMPLDDEPDAVEGDVSSSDTI